MGIGSFSPCLVACITISDAIVSYSLRSKGIVILVGLGINWQLKASHLHLINLGKRTEMLPSGIGLYCISKGDVGEGGRGAREGEMKIRRGAGVGGQSRASSQDRASELYR